MTILNIILIILAVLVLLMIVGSMFLGRATSEVESARDTEYVELEGDWVRYRVVGGGPPVVLVHGWLSSSQVWRELAGRLAQRFTVYSLDLKGFGDSDKPLSGYGVRYGSRLLYAFCAHFGLNRAAVVGHDFGGDMAVKLAADHPDLVGRLVLVATPANEDQVDLPTPLWLATRPVVGSLFFALGRVFAPVRKLWMRPFVSDGDDLPDYILEDAGKPTPASAGKTFSITRREISRGRLARQARIIKVPMLLVAGEDDQIVDPQAVSDWSRSVDRAEVHLIEGCGHLPMVENPAQFNAQVLAFLTGDSRYLDYAPEPPVPDETPEEDPPETLTPRAEPAGYAEYREVPGEDPDPAERFPDEPAEDPAAREDERRRADLPGISRRRPPDDERGNETHEDPNKYREAPAEFGDAGEPAAEAPDTEPDTGPDERAVDGEPPREHRERPRRSRGGGAGRIPEMPDDLFRWPGDLGSSRSREGSHRNGPADDGRAHRESEEHGEPEDPHRS